MKNLYGLFPFLICCLFGLQESLSAQTWERYIGTPTNWEVGSATTITVDKGFIIAGRKNAQIYVRRIDQDGDLIWEQTYLGANPPKNDLPYAIIQTTDGGFALTGTMGRVDTLNYDAFLLKIDKNGQEEWWRSFGGPDEDIGYSLAQTVDQGFIIAGAHGITFKDNTDQVSTSSNFLIRTDANGNILEGWPKIYGDTLADYVHSVIPLSNGDFAIHGVKGIPERGVDYAYLRISAEGDSLWTKTYGTASDNWATQTIRTDDGGFLQTGYTSGKGTYLIRYQEDGDTLWTKQFNYGQNNNFNQQATLSGNGLIYNLTTISNAATKDENFLLTAIDDTNGNQLWSKTLGKATENERAAAITVTKDGEIVLLGSVARPTLLPNVQSDILLIKASEVGNSLNYHVIGNVFIEENQDCSNPGGAPLNDWLIEAKGVNTYYAYTNEIGQYDLLLDTGNYEVRVIPRSPYWKSCVDAATIVATDFGETILNFGVKKEQLCPYLLVDISTPFLQPCDTAVYTVNYENLGTDTATNIFIELDFPAELKVLSLSDSLQPSNALYTFKTAASLAPLEKRSFQIVAVLECDVLPQATHAVTAHIYPDSLCIPPNAAWDGSSLIVSTNFKEDSLEFVIKNIGENMTTATSYVVIEDLVILRQGNLQLNQNDSLPILLPLNGRTYRLEVQQSSFHPGQSRPAISVETAASSSTTNPSLGFVTQFYEDDGNNFVAIDAQENLESFSDNRLIAAPKGIDMDRLIALKDDIEYQISFPIFKMEEDTFRLVIRDSLSEYLDLATFHAGISSHEYSVDITETGILKFIFEKIAVPNQDTTYGFVKFRIGQKETNQEGSLIENKISFYRDYELPKTFYSYQHNIGKKMMTGQITPHYYCKGTQFEAIPPSDTITRFSIDIININETIILPNITIEIDSLVPNNGGRIFIDTLVAQNGCDSIVIYNLLTDIEAVKLGQQAILVYPNPAQNQLSIQCNSQWDCLKSIQLYNVNGQQVLKHVFNDMQQDFQLDLSLLPNNLYLLRIATEKGVRYEKIRVLH